MRRLCLALAALALAACSNDTSPMCGEGTEPVLVTGLRGILEGGGPALEVQYRVPETCEVLDRAWVLFDDPTQSLSVVEAPPDVDLRTLRVEVGDDYVQFTDFAVIAQLVYPGGVVGPALTLEWSTGTGDPLGEVACVGEGEALACAVAAP